MAEANDINPSVRQGTSMQGDWAVAVRKDNWAVKPESPSQPQGGVSDKGVQIRQGKRLVRGERGILGGGPVFYCKKGKLTTHKPAPGRGEKRRIEASKLKKADLSGKQVKKSYLKERKENAG